MNTRNGGRGVSRDRIFVLAAISGSTLTASAAMAQGPAGEQVAAGSAAFTRNGDLTQITTSHTAIINYQSFNVAQGHTVQFIQPDATSRVLNRVLGPDPSQIAGTIRANGQVYIVNRAGVTFTNGSVIDVGGLYAAAGSIANDDFLSNIDRFTSLRGTVRNEGLIQASKAVLAGANVQNTGSINTPQGTVVFTAGDNVFIGTQGGSMYARVSGGAAGNGIANSGSVNAGTGSVIVATGDVFGMAIQHSGAIKAANAAITGGRGTYTSVSGSIDATNSAGSGGRVDVTGKNVALFNASIDASGSTGGGQINLGGEHQGSGSLARSESTYVSADSALRADATTSGSGGRVVAWSDGLTAFYGSASAQGTGTGSGGLLETSGRNGLSVNAQSIAIDGGNWVMDPSDITIAGADTNGFTVNNATGALTSGANTTGTINVANINTALAANANVVIFTSNAGQAGPAGGRINVTSAITAGAGTGSLALVANNNLDINANITLNSGLILISGSAGGFSAFGVAIPADTATAGGSVAINGNIATGGGSVIIRTGSAGGVSFPGGTGLDAGAGSIFMNVGTAGVSQGSPITAGILNIRSTGSVTLNNASNAVGLVAISAGTPTAAGNVSYQQNGSFAVSNPANLILGGLTEFGFAGISSGGGVAAVGGTIDIRSLTGGLTVSAGSPIASNGQTINLLGNNGLIINSTVNSTNNVLATFGGITLTQLTAAANTTISANITSGVNAAANAGGVIATGAGNTGNIVVNNSLITAGGNINLRTLSGNFTQNSGQFDTSNTNAGLVNSGGNVTINVAPTFTATLDSDTAPAVVTGTGNIRGGSFSFGTIAGAGNQGSFNLNGTGGITTNGGLVNLQAQTNGSNITFNAPINTVLTGATGGTFTAAANTGTISSNATGTLTTGGAAINIQTFSAGGTINLLGFTDTSRAGVVGGQVDLNSAGFLRSPFIDSGGANVNLTAGNGILAASILTRNVALSIFGNVVLLQTNAAAATDLNGLINTGTVGTTRGGTVTTGVGNTGAININSQINTSGGVVTLRTLSGNMTQADGSGGILTDNTGLLVGPSGGTVTLDVAQGSTITLDSNAADAVRTGVGTIRGADFIVGSGAVLPNRGSFNLNGTGGVRTNGGAININANNIGSTITISGFLNTTFGSVLGGAIDLLTNNGAITINDPLGGDDFTTGGANFTAAATGPGGSIALDGDINTILSAGTDGGNIIFAAAGNINNTVFSSMTTGGGKVTMTAGGAIVSDTNINTGGGDLLTGPAGVDGNDVFVFGTTGVTMNDERSGIRTFGTNTTAVTGGRVYIACNTDISVANVITTSGGRASFLADFDSNGSGVLTIGDNASGIFVGIVTADGFNNKPASVLGGDVRLEGVRVVINSDAALITGTLNRQNLATEQTFNGNVTIRPRLAADITVGPSSGTEFLSSASVSRIQTFNGRLTIGGSHNPAALAPVGSTDTGDILTGVTYSEPGAGPSADANEVLALSANNLTLNGFIAGNDIRGNVRIIAANSITSTGASSSAVNANLILRVDGPGDFITLNAGVGGRGQTLVQAGGAINQNANVSADNLATLHSGVSGTGNLIFGAGSSMNADNIVFRAGNGTVGGTALIDASGILAQRLQGSPNNTRVTSFTFRSDASIQATGGTGSILPPGTAFFNLGVAAPGESVITYTVQSDGGTVNINANGLLDGTNLTLRGFAAGATDAVIISNRLIVDRLLVEGSPGASPLAQVNLGASVITTGDPLTSTVLPANQAGRQQYNLNAVVSGGSFATPVLLQSNSAGTIAFAGTINGSAANTGNLVINTNAATNLNTNVGSTNSLASLRTDFEGIVTFAGQAVGDAVPLFATLNAGTNSLTLLNVFTDGAQIYNDFAVNLNGTTYNTNTDGVGAGGAFFIDNGNAAATTTLNANVIITGGNNLTVFDNRIDSGVGVGSPFSLTVNEGGLLNGGGNTIFNAAIGSINPLASLTTDAAGEVNIRANVTTVGDQIYNDSTSSTGVSPANAVTIGNNLGTTITLTTTNSLIQITSGNTLLTDNLVISTGSGNVTVNGTVNADNFTNNRTLTVNSAGTVVFTGNIGEAVNGALFSVTSDSAGNTGSSTFNRITTRGTGGGSGIFLLDPSVTLAGDNYDATRSGNDAGSPITFNSALGEELLLTSTNVSIRADAGTILFNGTVQSSGGTNRNLTVQGSGTIQFADDVGGGVSGGPAALQSLDVATFAGGATNLIIFGTNGLPGGPLAAGTTRTVRTIGGQRIFGNTTTNDNTTPLGILIGADILFEASGAGSQLDIAGFVNADRRDNNRTLEAQTQGAASSISFGNDIGFAGAANDAGNGSFATVTIGSNARTPDSVSLAQVRTTGDQFYIGTVINLFGAQYLANDNAGIGNITFGDENALAIQAVRIVRFGPDLVADRTVSVRAGTSIFFNSTIDSNDPGGNINALFTEAPQITRFAHNIGAGNAGAGVGVGRLARIVSDGFISLGINGTNAVTQFGGIALSPADLLVLTSSSNTQIYNNAILLATNTVFGDNNNGDINFNNTINGDGVNPRSMAVRTRGVTRFRNNVGLTNALDELVTDEPLGSPVGTAYSTYAGPALDPLEVGPNTANPGQNRVVFGRLFNNGSAAVIPLDLPITIQTTGQQSYNDVDGIRLADSTTFRADTGTIAFNTTINGDFATVLFDNDGPGGNAPVVTNVRRNLTVRSGGDVTFAGSIGFGDQFATAADAAASSAGTAVGLVADGFAQGPVALGSITVSNLNLAGNAVDGAQLFITQAHFDNNVGVVAGGIFRTFGNQTYNYDIVNGALFEGISVDTTNTLFASAESGNISFNGNVFATAETPGVAVRRLFINTAGQTAFNGMVGANYTRDAGGVVVARDAAGLRFEQIVTDLVDNGDGAEFVSAVGERGGTTRFSDDVFLLGRDTSGGIFNQAAGPGIAAVNYAPRVALLANDLVTIRDGGLDAKPAVPPATQALADFITPGETIINGGQGSLIFRLGINNVSANGVGTLTLVSNADALPVGVAGGAGNGFLALTDANRLTYIQNYLAPIVIGQNGSGTGIGTAASRFASVRITSNPVAFRGALDPNPNLTGFDSNANVAGRGTGTDATSVPILSTIVFVDAAAVAPNGLSHLDPDQANVTNIGLLDSAANTPNFGIYTTGSAVGNGIFIGQNEKIVASGNIELLAGIGANRGRIVISDINAAGVANGFAGNLRVGEGLNLGGDDIRIQQRVASSIVKFINTTLTVVPDQGVDYVAGSSITFSSLPIRFGAGGPFFTAGLRPQFSTVTGENVVLAGQINPPFTIRRFKNALYTSPLPAALLGANVNQFNDDSAAPVIGNLIPFDLRAEGASIIVYSDSENTVLEAVRELPFEPTVRRSNREPWFVGGKAPSRLIEEDIVRKVRTGNQAAPARPATSAAPAAAPATTANSTNRNAGYTQPNQAAAGVR